MAKIFLETTILIQRLLYEERRVAEIEETLAGKYICTSAFVLMEFRRSILQALNYLRSLILEMEQQGRLEIRLDEFFVVLSQGRGIFHSTRAVQSVFLALSAISESFSGGVLSTTRLIRELEWQIDGLEINATRGIDDIINNTRCDLAKETAPIGDFLHSRLSCNAAKATCQLVNFLEEHRDELRKIEQAMAAAPREKVDVRTLAALRRVNADITKALGERTCWALGDVIIALEAPPDAEIFTADRQFEVILKAIDKRLFLEEAIIVNE